MLKTMLILVMYDQVCVNIVYTGFLANVEYHEIDLSAEFPAEYLKYIPNIHYSSTHQFGAHR